MWGTISKIIGLFRRQSSGREPSATFNPKRIHLGHRGNWDKVVELPAKGQFVCESHYLTEMDMKNYPVDVREGIGNHLINSVNALRDYFPAATTEQLMNFYNTSYKKQWTPAENGKIGQGARGKLRLSVLEEMFQGNMMFRGDSLPPVGTKFLVKVPNTNKACVIQMGFEIGPPEEKYLGGLTPEVHAVLGTTNDSIIELSYCDQDLKLGPV